MAIAQRQVLFNGGLWNEFNFIPGDSCSAQTEQVDWPTLARANPFDSEAMHGPNGSLTVTDDMRKMKNPMMYCAMPLEHPGNRCLQIEDRAMAELLRDSNTVVTMHLQQRQVSESILRRSGTPYRIALALAATALSVLLVGCATKPDPAPARKPAASKPAPSARNEPSSPAPNRRPRSGNSEPAAPSAPVAKAERNLVRPSQGSVIQRFDGRNNKGIDFAGSEGDPVTAARDGTVVYAAVGPRGYGQLVMIKHDAVSVTAYAHNSQLLVKEGQSVKRGQPIARMGRTESDRVKLHFELRRNGNAVDPAPYFMGDQGLP